MTKQEIIETLKNSYSRDIRKQLVKTIVSEEKENELPNYKLINQIFSYVLSELGWDMAKSTKDWDATPLDIMEESFPKIKTTQWYKEQILTAKQAIDVELKD
jgi:hypothetical protein